MSTRGYASGEFCRAGPGMLETTLHLEQVYPWRLDTVGELLSGRERETGSHVTRSNDRVWKCMEYHTQDRGIDI